jgi:hypothetical protein
MMICAGNEESDTGHLLHKLDLTGRFPTTDTVVCSRKTQFESE